MSVVEHFSVNRPCLGEQVSGDAAVIRPLEHGLFAAIVDVLGHGPEAYDLTLVIDAELARCVASGVSGLMTRLHQHLKGTRGAAVGLCAIDAATGRIYLTARHADRGQGTYSNPPVVMAYQVVVAPKP